MNLSIRPEHEADVDAIAALTIAAFRTEPRSSHTEQFIVNSLRKAGALTVSLVAESESTVIGHVAISPVSISDGSNGWFGLGPISVQPEHQGGGVGTMLMSAALDRLKSLGARGCVLLGDPSFYARFGFKNEPGIELPGVPAEYFQALCFSGPMPSGKISYHEAFDAE